MTLRNFLRRLYGALVIPKHSNGLDKVKDALARKQRVAVIRGHAEADTRQVMKTHAGLFTIDDDLNQMARVMMPNKDDR